jgi:hypothetical protein
VPGWHLLDLTDQGCLGRGVSHSDGDLLVRKLNFNLDVAVALSDAFRDEFTDDECRVIDETVGQPGWVAHFVDEFA